MIIYVVYLHAVFVYGRGTNRYPLKNVGKSSQIDSLLIAGIVRRKSAENQTLLERIAA
jgi:hypothetical protein